MLAHLLTACSARALLGGLALIVAGLGAPAAPAQPAEGLPVADQMPLFVKILSFEQQLMPEGEAISVGVLYQERYRASTLAKEEASKALQALTLGGKPVRAVPIAFEDGRSLGEALGNAGVHALYVTPLRAADVSAIAAAARQRGVLTLTGEVPYAESGLSVALGLRAGRPRIVINMPAAAAEGARFHSQLLGLAELIREEAP